MNCAARCSAQARRQVSGYDLLLVLIEESTRTREMMVYRQQQNGVLEKKEDVVGVAQQVWRAVETVTSY